MLRLVRQRFKLKNKDELYVNLGHLAPYILAQNIYIDNQYRIYKALKEKKLEIFYKNILGAREAQIQERQLYI